MEEAEKPARRNRLGAALQRTAAGRLIVGLGLLLASGCASPSSRIADELTGYGFDPTQAACVGDRLQSNLSLSQLRQLSRAAGALSEGDTTPGRLTASDLFRAASRLNDPKVPIEVAKAAPGAECSPICSSAQPGVDPMNGLHFDELQEKQCVN